MADNDGMQKMLPEADAFKRKYARHPLCARTSYSCNKLFLFIYTLLFLVSGCLNSQIICVGEKSGINPLYYTASICANHGQEMSKNTTDRLMRLWHLSHAYINKR